MPLFGGSPIAAYAAVTDLKTPTTVTLTADIATAVLVPDASRKGHLTLNSGATNVTVLFGVADPTDTVEPFTFKECYRFTLKPGDAYLSDFPEIFPYSATSPAANGQLTVREFI